jgi:hypothetical protein
MRTHSLQAMAAALLVNQARPLLYLILPEEVVLLRLRGVEVQWVVEGLSHHTTQLLLESHYEWYYDCISLTSLSCSNGILRQA